MLLATFPKITWADYASVGQVFTYIPSCKQWHNHHLTEHHPAVLPVHFEQPGLGGLGPVVDELLQTLAVDLQRVLVGEPADGLDGYGGFGVGGSHGEGFLPNQLEHPVFSDDFLLRKQVAAFMTDR